MHFLGSRRLAARMGATFVPLDVKNMATDQGIIACINQIRPDSVVVWNRTDLNTLERLGVLNEVRVNICVEDPANGTLEGENRKSMREMLQIGIGIGRHNIPPVEPDVDPEKDFALCVLTSGTTGVPKICPHTGANISAFTYTYIRWRNLDNRHSSLLQHLPNHHALSCTNQISWWRSGGTVVYPSPFFDAKATLDALESGYCTDMSVVPSIFTALTMHSSFDRRQMKNLEVIGSGATMVPPDFLSAARKRLSARYSTVAFGMSEGMGILGWHLHEQVSHDGSFVGVGKAGYGVGIKICAPGSRHPLHRGELGELHVSGRSIIGSYLGTDSQSFYTDNEGRDWFITGDQAKMEDSGSVYIYGRYKDLIIRGGKNISPAALEASLDKYDGVSAQVIGVPDNLAGEVPVAVIKLREGTTLPATSLLVEKVMSECGADSALARIIFLPDLGLKEFPMSGSGKVKKRELRAMVSSFLQHEVNTKASQNNPVTTLKRLVQLLANLLAQPEKDVPLSISLDRIADSMTIVGLRSEIKRIFGTDISGEELMQNGGLKAISTALNNKSFTPAKEDRPVIEPTRREGPPGHDDMIHVCGSPSDFIRTRQAVDPRLDDLNLSWENDIQDVYPVPDFSFKHLTRSRAYNYNLRLSLHVTHTSASQVRAAIEASMAIWSVLRSIAVDYHDGQRLFAEIRPGEQWYNQCILQDDIYEVQNPEDVKVLARSGLIGIHAQLPGPLFKAIIVDIKNTGDVGVVIIANHAVFDAFSMVAWREDLEQLLHNTPNKPSRIRYKNFADHYYNYRASPSAASSVAFFAKHLEGVGEWSISLWPPQNAPQWFIGNDIGWRYPDGSLGEPGKRLSLGTNQKMSGLDGVVQSIQLPFLQRLYYEARIPASTLLKAALALLTVSQTGQDVAMMGSVQAGRQWPFIDRWLAQRLPNPMEIAGSTHTNVPHVIRIDRREPVLTMLKRLTEEQEAMMRHAHVPYFLLDAKLSAADREMHLEMKRRQTYNWVPHWPSKTGISIANEASSTIRGQARVHVLQADRHFNFGILWNCGLDDPTTVRVHALYDDAQIRNEEMVAHVEQLLKIAQWMQNPANWGKSIGTCLVENKE